MNEKIVVLGTGGTIAGRASSGHDNVGYSAGEVPVEVLLQGVELPPDVEVVAEQVAQVDSKDMDFAVWRRLAGRGAHWLAQPDVRGIVVTHGTDTMEETAYFLQALLAPSKPVVMTGAMRPASSFAADGPRNLADAFCVARWPGAKGVVVAFAGCIHGARDVAKQHPYKLDPFTSGDAGCLGYVEEGRLRLVRPWPVAGSIHAGAALGAIERSAEWPRVEIVMNHAGADGRMVDSLIRDAVDGIVVAGTGNGTVSASLEAALERARSAGVRIAIASRCAQGSIVRGEAEGIDSDWLGLSPVKARVAMILALLAAAQLRGS